MSTTKSEPGALKTFASLRFMGDRLEPARVTKILGISPTTAYSKGEVFKQSRGQHLRGCTGIWLLSSDGRVAEPDLDDHLRYLLAVLFSGNSDAKVRKLHDLMRDQQITADVSCFWYGEAGAQAPEIPEDVRAAFSRLPAQIETDFDTD